MIREITILQILQVKYKSFLIFYLLIFFYLVLEIGCNICNIVIIKRPTILNVIFVILMVLLLYYIKKPF